MAQLLVTPAAVLDRERHEMQETLEDGFARIDQAMKALGKVP